MSRDSVTQAALVLWVALIVLSSGSCTGEKGCNQFGAENYSPDAAVDDGSCIEVRDKFVGSFSVSGDCKGGAYTRTISPTVDRFIVTISNISDTLGVVSARVSGSSIIIDDHPIRNNVFVEGAGVFDTTNNVLNLSYRIRDQRGSVNRVVNCFETCTKNS